MGVLAEGEYGALGPEECLFWRGLRFGWFGEKPDDKVGFLPLENSLYLAHY